MLKKYVIHDTLHAYIKEGDNDRYFGLTTASNISKSVTQEELKAGIHNKTFYVMNIDDGMKFSVTTGLHYQDVYEIQTGQKFEAKSDITTHKIVESPDGTITATEETLQAGEVLEFTSGSFPKNSHVQLRTIAYDIKTGRIAADVYYIFPQAMADGNLNEDFGAGTNKTQEISFTAMVPEGKDSYGQMIVIPRNQTEDEEDVIP